MYRYGKLEVNFDNYQSLTGQSETNIVVDGKYSQYEDFLIFDAISNSYQNSVTKLELKFLNLTHVKELTIFPNLKDLTLGVGTLSMDFLKFNKWCPNLETLKINDTGFEDDSEDDWLSIAETHESPLVRSLTITVNIDSKEDVYYCLEAMDKQFPMLENLFLEFGGERNFTLNKTVPNFSAVNLTSTYEPVYFGNVKKLSVSAYGDCDDIFNYLKISNAKVKDITFWGMNAEANLIKSLCNYPKLNKLQLRCPYVYEDELDELCNGLPKLMILALDVKVFHWRPSDMMEFMKNSIRLRHLRIDVDRRRNNLIFDEKFKDEFKTLVDSGRKFLKLDIKFFQSSQEIHLSRKVVIDRPPSPLNETNGWF